MKLAEQLIEKLLTQDDARARYRAEASSQLITQMRELAKKYGGWNPIAKADGVICTFDSARKAEQFTDAVSATYPSYDWIQSESDPTMVSVGERDAPEFTRDLTHDNYAQFRR
jgi:pyruvate-formate lyase